jgi:predicted dehydrogenase
MNIAVIGCGYIAESYVRTLGNYPHLHLVGAYDRNESNLRAFCQRWSTRNYATLTELLDDSSIEIVLNLTNPRSHYEVTRQCIEAKKHVYSEKPLAMEFEKARELVDLAERVGVYLACAPCSMLSETAQTVWKALREGIIGQIRLVYANFDDGMIAPHMAPWNWRNESGAPWPAKDEFEVGCTYEHAGYVLTWLACFFGPARSVTSFASCLIPDKGISVDRMAPDFTVGCIEYEGGIVARVTCGLVAPRDKSLLIVGDGGVLTVANVRDDRCPVYMRVTPLNRWQAAIERRLNNLRNLLRSAPREDDWLIWKKYTLVNASERQFDSKRKRVDFCRGPAELAAALEEHRPCRLSAQLGLHITELIEGLQYPERFGFRRKLTSSFAPIEPLQR